MPKKAAAAAPRSPSRRVTMTNAERSAETRAQVLRAAAECFEVSGYLATTLDQILARTNLTKGAVYFHFGSKEALALALIDAQRQRWPRIIDDAVSRPGTPVEQLVALTYDVLGELRNDVILRAGLRLASDPDVPGVDPAQLVGEWTQVVQGMLRRSRRDKSFPPQSVARVVVAFMIGAIHLAQVADNVADTRRRLDDFWSMVLPQFR